MNDFQSSALDQTDGMTVAAAATVGSQQPADAQYLRRHCSTYSQHKELKPYRENAKQRAVEAREAAQHPQRPVKGDFPDIDVDELTRGGGGVGGPAVASADRRWRRRTGGGVGGPAVASADRRWRRRTGGGVGGPAVASADRRRRLAITKAMTPSIFRACERDMKLGKEDQSGRHRNNRAPPPPPPQDEYGDEYYRRVVTISDARSGR